MLLWLFLLGLTFSFIIPAVNFYLSEKNVSYIYYILYILFSVVWVLFTFVKYNGLVLFPNIDMTQFYNYERVVNSFPALLYYIFLWNYVLKSQRSKLYRNVLRYVIGLYVIILPILTVVDVLQVDFINAQLITLIGSLLILILVLALCVFLLRDPNKVFKIIGFGLLSFLFFVTISLIVSTVPSADIFLDNPHKLYLIGMIVELTVLNYALNLSNLEYRDFLILEKNQFEGIALRSQMNPHFVHNSLNAILYFIQRNEVDFSEQYLSKFSKLIRLFFEYSRRQTISLAEEIGLLTHYLEIEKLRFEDKLSYNVTVADDIDPGGLQIPSMLLQPIVENGVNHGLFHKLDKGTISINFSILKTNELKVEIEDDGIGFKKAKALLKTSSKNYQSRSTAVLKERLELLNQTKEWQVNYKIEDISEIEKDKTGTIVTLIFTQLNSQ